jgi:hypothetical protein
MGALPVLTDVVRLPNPTVPHAALQDWLLQALPPLVTETVVALQPQLEQQLLDALMPRLMASLAQWHAEQAVGDSLTGKCNRLP